MNFFRKINNLHELINILIKAEERSVIPILLRTQDLNFRQAQSVIRIKNTADPRSTMFSKSANPLDLPHKSTICALFKSKSVDPKTYSPPSSKVERTVILVKKSDLLWGIWLSEQFMYQFLMYQSNRSFNIPPSRATPWAFEFFENFCSYSTSHWAEKLSKYPHPQKNYQITVLTFQ